MYYEDFEPGMKWDIAGIKITREEMLEFARRYDSAPVHADEEYGKNSRFGDIICPGTLSAMKLWNAWLQYKIPGEEFIAGLFCHMEWQAPIMPGDILSGKAYVSEKEDRNLYNGIVYIVVEGFNQKGEQVVKTTNCLVMKKLITADK